MGGSLVLHMPRIRAGTRGLTTPRGWAGFFDSGELWHESRGPPSGFDGGDSDDGGAEAGCGREMSDEGMEDDTGCRNLGGIGSLCNGARESAGFARGLAHPGRVNAAGFAWGLARAGRVVG